MTDIITQLGHLCMGSRLKRLGERMQAGVTEALEARGHAVQPGQMPLLVALAQADGGPMTIGALADAIGISQPGATRAAAKLMTLGFTEPADNPGDKRQRAIALTPVGRALIDDLSASLFPFIESAVARLCADAGADLLAVVGQVEAGLDAHPLGRRIDGETSA